MNAFLLMSVALVSGDHHAAPVAAPAVVASAGCGGCSNAPACDSGCSKVSLLDKIKARFAKSSSCGCETKTACAAPACAKSCDTCSKPSILDRLKAKFAKKSSCGCDAAPACAAPAPACAPACEPKCKPACGTPLLSKPVFHGITTSCKDSCDSGCDKPSLLDKLKAKFASKKHSGCDSTPSCGGCSAAAPAGCSLPPAPGAAPVVPATPADAPKTMPKPVEAPKKTSSLLVPSVVTPASSTDLIPVVPAPAPMPTKSPF